RIFSLRGVLVEEPVYMWRPANDPLRTMPQTPPESESNDWWGEIPPPNATLSVLQVTHVAQKKNVWIPASGRARLVVEGSVRDIHAGDSVEVIGRLATPQGPQNPGEADYAANLRDQGIRAVIAVVKTSEGVTLIEKGWPYSLTGI